MLGGSEPQQCMFAVDLACRPAVFNNSRRERLASVADTAVQHPEVAGVEHEYIAAAGMQLHVARAGINAKRPLILFLHGFPECAPSATSPKTPALGHPALHYA